MGRRLTFVLALSLALAACIPDAGDDDIDASPPAPAAAARAGGTLRIAVDPLAGIDPTDARDPATRMVARTMCDQLVMLDPATGTPKPALAESWTVADGGRKLFLKLRPGVRFHDGSSLDADDVVSTLSRLADERFAAPAADLIRPIAGFEFVHGEAETPNRKLREQLAGVSAVDGKTVQVSLTRPYADFLMALSDPATSPIPRGAAEANAFARSPVCAGPYRVAQPWTPGEPVRLRRFEGYHGGAAAYSRGGTGWADEIVFVPFESRARGLAAFKRGEVDVAQVPDGASPRGVRTSFPTGLREYVGFPTTLEPFNDARVRRALAIALDREVIAREVYRGGRVPATGLARGAPPCDLPPSTEPTDPKVILSDAQVSLSGVRVPFYFNDDHDNRGLVSVAAAVWRKEFGLRAEPKPMVWGDYIALGRRPQGFDGIYRLGWQAEYPSPERELTPLFSLASIGVDNLGAYGSPAFEAPMRSARKATDAAERLEHYRRAARVACTDMPMTPIVEDTRTYVRAPHVGAAVEHWGAAADGTAEARELFLAR